MKVKAYIIPSVDVDGETKNLVLKTNLVASMAAGKSSSSIGYLMEGETKRKYGNIMLERIFGKFKSYSAWEFNRVLKKEFGNCGFGFLEDKVETFAEKHGLVPTKLIFTN